MAVGKRRDIQYRANEQVYSFVNAAGNKMDVAFRVSDDGLAFRYVVADAAIPLKRFVSEASGFAFDAKTRAFLQPLTGTVTPGPRSVPESADLDTRLASIESRLNAAGL